MSPRHRKRSTHTFAQPILCIQWLETGSTTNASWTLEEWRAVRRQAENLPPVLQVIVALDAWNEPGVLQHAPWLGRLLAASILRQAGVTTVAHLVAFYLGLKSIPVGRRRHRDRETRLLAIAQSLTAAAEIGLKEHDRLALARQMMERTLAALRSKRSKTKRTIPRARMSLRIIAGRFSRGRIQLTSETPGDCGMRCISSNCSTAAAIVLARRQITFDRSSEDTPAMGVSPIARDFTSIDGASRPGSVSHPGSSTKIEQRSFQDEPDDQQHSGGKHETGQHRTSR
ncbi:hypothetical protein IE4872_PD02092 (plasmid) [Rhizobium gallicum]|uniref:DUF1612 domain-containing protein n=1 Tax=Rhizobium gallicum TaxID=56730 RepID=A0A1L5NXK1_9HYPH|nr:hypothetical protein IE4872_PD02092 [Rhizobium gallicum]